MMDTWTRTIYCNYTNDASNSIQVTSTSRDSNKMEALSEITNCSPKRRKIDPLWHLLDKIGDKRYCQLCRKDYHQSGLN